MTTEVGTATAAEPGTSDAPRAQVADGALAPQQSVLARLQGVPVTIRKYLLSADLDARHKKIFDEHGIAKDDQDMVYYTELQTFFGEILLADFPDRAWVRLDWDDAQEDKALALVTDILGYVFLPAQAHLGDVSGLISELGGDTKKYPEKQLELRRVSFADGAKEIAEAAALDGLGDDMRKRLAHIIESRLRSVRDDVEVKEMLMKAKKTGGMELSEADADKVIGMLSSKVRMTSFTEQVEEKKSPAEAAAPSTEAPKRELAPIEIKKLYSGTPEEQEAIGKRLERFSKVTEGDPAKMRDAYYQVLYPPDGRPTDPMYVVAGLLAMADKDRISEALQEDERYRNILMEYLKDKGGDELVAEYQVDPTTPRFMNIFFQFLLRGIAGYDEKESARFL